METGCLGLILVGAACRSNVLPEWDPEAARLVTHIHNLAAGAKAAERRIGRAPTTDDLQDEIAMIEGWVPCRFLSLRVEDRILYVRVAAAGKEYEVIELYPNNRERRPSIRRVR
jgi:hypothetical protein